MLLLSATAFTLLFYQALAVPHPNGAAGLTMSLTRRSSTPRTDEGWGKLARTQKQALETKYGGKNLATRGTGTNL